MINGAPKTVSDYRNWRKDLVDCLGNFCCYCNMVLYDSPQVEHVIAQNIDPVRSLDWDNMLLACGSCNRSKDNKPCPPETHYLPQYHNTQIAFSYSIVNHPDQLTTPAAFVTWRALPAAENKANNTINLCALNRDTTRIAAQVTDLRWKYRHEAFRIASLWKTDWDDWGHAFASRFIPLLLTAATGKGFWPIWYDTFSNVQDIRRALVQHFPGTAVRCFDPVTFDPIPRNPGNQNDSI